MEHRLTITGPPVTKKNSQQMAQNRKTGKWFPVQSPQLRAWTERAVWELRDQWRQPVLTVPVNMAAVIYRQRATGDLLNYLAAVSDALEAAGVVENDRLIVGLEGCRLEKDSNRPRVEVVIRRAG